MSDFQRQRIRSTAVYTGSMLKTNNFVEVVPEFALAKVRVEPTFAFHAYACNIRVVAEPPKRANAVDTDEVASALGALDCVEDVPAWDSNNTSKVPSTFDVITSRALEV